MEFQKSGRKRQRGVRNVGKENLDDTYSHRLQFYKLPPTDTISLFEFEEFALERLKVLKAVENAGVKFIKNTDKYQDYVCDELRKTSFKRLTHVLKDSDNDEFKLRRLDHISHFILRLAYCRSDELRRWFLQQELDLFRFRFQMMGSKEEKNRFLEINNLHYEHISEDERNQLLEKLAAVRNGSASTVETLDYFKVPFTEALDLVQKRRVYLQKGMAYVPYNDMVSILLAVYRTQLSLALAMTSRAVPHLEEDERLLPMLSSLSKRYLGADYNIKKTIVGQITADMIDALCKKQAFPPCMQQLHQSLRQSHHLRHGGRQQYGLFLKGTGLSLDEAMKFWRTEFTKLIDGDKFDKQYSYNIRHNYGKEGKRADYTPYSCLKIIMSNTPGPGDNHGCPFKHTDLDLLKQKLKSVTVPGSISGDFYDRIIENVKQGQYNVACTRYFEAMHKQSIDSQINAISHPNQYFEESQKLEKGISDKTNVGTPKTQRVVTHSSQFTPKSQTNPNSQSASTPQLNGLEEMDDDFDIEAAEKSMTSID